jgi:hypothetical protein
MSTLTNALLAPLASTAAALWMVMKSLTSVPPSTVRVLTSWNHSKSGLAE